MINWSDIDMFPLEAWRSNLTRSTDDKQANQRPALITCTASSSAQATLVLETQPITVTNGTWKYSKVLSWHILSLAVTSLVGKHLVCWISGAYVGGSPLIILPFWMNSCLPAWLTDAWLLVQSESNTMTHSIHEGSNQSSMASEVATKARRLQLSMSLPMLSSFYCYKKVAQCHIHMEHW